MSDIVEARKALIARVLEGPGHVSLDRRTTAFDNAKLEEPLSTLIGKIATRPLEVTDQDVAAARAIGLTDDQIFELVVCAAIGQATRQNDVALAALKAAAGKL